MANIFIPHRNQTAEASLQRSFEQSVRQLEKLTKQLMAWRSMPNEDNFPKPDLSQLGTPPDIPPDTVKAELQSRTIAATAAILTEAYGEGGQYQAEGYTIQRLPQDGRKTSYQITENRSRHIVFTFERDDDGVLKVSENQLSSEQNQDFLQVAQRITQLGFAPLEADRTGATLAEALGHLAPISSAAPQSAKRPILRAERAQDQASVTPLDLVQWRYASILLGRGQGQVEKITGMAQVAATVQGQSFLQMYQQARLAPLSLQPKPQDLTQMRQDIDQLKDLVWQVGPQRVEQLFQTQRQLTVPVQIASNSQVAAPRYSQPYSPSAQSSER